MDNIWAKINNKVPHYFKGLAAKYSMKFVKVNSLKTAIIGNKFIILVSIDRFYADIDYIMRNKKNEMIIYKCGNFFAERYDKDDRKNLVQGNDVGDLVINNLIIINNGLQNKWSDVLKGNIEWVNEYKTSKWFEKGRVNQLETAILSRYI